jgi:hypothetical protein
MIPFRSLLMIASSDDVTIAASRAASIWLLVSLRIFAARAKCPNVAPTPPTVKYSAYAIT